MKKTTARESAAKSSPNRNTGRMIAKNLIILLTLVVIVFVGMWAWFTEDTSTTANGISISTGINDGLEIAVVDVDAAAPGGADYSSSVDLTNYTEKDQFLELLRMGELTSDGVSVIKPPITQANGIAEVDTTAEWDPDAISTTANRDYLSFDLYVRSESSHNVALSASSSIEPVTPTDQLVWYDGGRYSSRNPSNYGDFSKDCVVGAVRFSTVEVSKTGVMSSVPSLLWLPAGNIQLTESGGEYTLVTNLAEDTSDTFKHYYYTSDKVLHEYNVNDNASFFVAPTTKDYKLGERRQILSSANMTTTQTYNGKTYYVGHVRCNLWIEGQDSEARLATVGGNFTTTLNLEIF